MRTRSPCSSYLSAISNEILSRSHSWVVARYSRVRFLSFSLFVSLPLNNKVLFKRINFRAREGRKECRPMRGRKRSVPDRMRVGRTSPANREQKGAHKKPEYRRRPAKVVEEVVCGSGREVRPIFYADTRVCPGVSAANRVFASHDARRLRSARATRGKSFI